MSVEFVDGMVSDELQAQSSAVQAQAAARLGASQMTASSTAPPPPLTDRPTSRAKTPVQQRLEEDRAAAEKQRKEVVDAEEREQRRIAFERAKNKLALGMMSSRFQRFEVSVTGRQRGPVSLAQDPQYAVVPPAPRPPREGKPPGNGRATDANAPRSAANPTPRTTRSMTAEVREELTRAANKFGLDFSKMCPSDNSWCPNS